MIDGDVGHFVPDRHRDGYGLQAATIERLHADGARLIISVDCGIRATEAAVRARDLGVDLIITDHHEPEADLPPALAVLNPKRADCGYPEKGLSGVGRGAEARPGADGRHRVAAPSSLPHFLKVAAIGTLADVVPLVGENRVIARLRPGRALERARTPPASTRCSRSAAWPRKRWTVSTSASSWRRG